MEVVYLEDLMAEVLYAKPELRQQFLDQWIYEAGIRTDMYHDIIKMCIRDRKDGAEVRANSNVDTLVFDGEAVVGVKIGRAHV